MSSPEPIHLHGAFGLTIRSCLPLPELLPTAAGPSADVEVLYGAVPTVLPDAIAQGVRFQAASGKLLLNVADVARYLVEDGRRITIARERGATDAEVRLFLLGPVLGALLHQRGDLVLHGSVIGFDGEAVALLGVVGSGKSALAAALCRAGMAFLADDHCVVRASPRGDMHAVPGYPLFKLWPDALQQLGLAPEAVGRVRSGVNKRALHAEIGCVASRPLNTVIVLSSTNGGELSFTPVNGTRKFNVLRGQIYRPRFRTNEEDTQFTSLLALAQQAELTILTRPRTPFRLPELALRVLTELRG